MSAPAAARRGKLRRRGHGRPPGAKEDLAEEVRRLRNAIHAHRGSSLHELCWHHPALWGLQPEKTDPLPVVPEWPECDAYDSLRLRFIDPE